MNKTIHNTLSSRGNERTLGIEMFRQVYPELVEGLKHDKQPKTQEIIQLQLHKKTTLLVMLNLVQHLIIQPITSLRVAKRIEKSNLQIFKLLILLLFPFWGLGGYSQTFNWDWAVNGAGPLGDTRDEQIYDVK